MVLPDSPVPVTRENWRHPECLRWALWHTRELLPSARVGRGTVPLPLPAGEPATVTDVEVERLGGTPGTVGQVLAESYTDAVVVLQDGALVHEWYGPEGGAHRAHLLMSVSKSVVGCVAAVLAERGIVDLDRAAADYVPELPLTGYGSATPRQLLDMRSGVHFVEDYDDPASDVRRLDEWIGWQPGKDPGPPRGLYRFLEGLVQDEPHGTSFRYRSSETDALGWVLERAAALPMAELISRIVWAPLGAEDDADLVCDGSGTAVHDGGLCATARDIARLGRMLLDAGQVSLPDGQVGQVVPPEWLRASWAVDVAGRKRFAQSLSEASFPGGWYSNQFWFRPGAYGDVLLGLGIYGQMLYANRSTRTVCVKFSSWPTAADPLLLLDTLRAFDALGAALSGQAEHGSGLTGGATGLHRGQDGAAPAPRR